MGGRCTSKRSMSNCLLYSFPCTPAILLRSSFQLWSVFGKSDAWPSGNWNYCPQCVPQSSPCLFWRAQWLFLPHQLLPYLLTIQHIFFRQTTMPCLTPFEHFMQVCSMGFNPIVSLLKCSSKTGQPDRLSFLLLLPRLSHLMSPAMAKTSFPSHLSGLVPL